MRLLYLDIDSLRQPGRVDEGLPRLAEWYRDMARTTRSDVDPMMTLLRAGGPFHTRDRLPSYLQRLYATERSHAAEKLQALYP